jgi:hypothetical protein
VPAVPYTCPEFTLLCRCLASSPDADAIAEVRQCLSRSLDWDYLVRTARRNRTLTLLYWTLSRSGPERVPAPVLQQLRSHFEALQCRNQQLTDELLRILEALADRGIPAVPYKGPVLAMSAYKNLALREFQDLDVIIHKEDLPKVKDVLITAGFEPHVHESYRDEADALQYGYNLAFFRPQGNIKLEIHWAFTSDYLPFPVDLRYLRTRLEPFVLTGRTVQNIAPEELLLILCVHASKHLWHSLIMVSDVAELIRGNPALDWPRIVEQSAALGSTRMLLLGLLLVNVLLSTDIPSQLLEMAHADRFVPSMATEVMESQCDETRSRPAALGFYVRLML